MGKGLAEYVIRLGTEIDNSGFQQMLNLLDTSKLKALGITAALTAATTAIYKFVESTTKQEFELRKLAKTQKKSVDTINAQNKALQAMGKTLDEVQKDKVLSKTYKDILAFNKELKLTNVDAAISKIQELQGAFWKLKSGLNYVVQNIGRLVMNNLVDPIKRITGGLDKISDWIKNNFSSISMKVATVITAFAKGIIGIAETVGKIFKWIGEMPSGIKSIAAALAAVVGLLSSGPLGKIMALVGLIGDVIHDAENYQWNKEKGYEPGDENYVRTLNDKNGIWDIFFGPGSTEDKAYDITKKFFDGVNEALKNFSTLLDTSFVEDWLSEPTGILGQILSGISAYFKGEEGSGALSDLIINAFESVMSLAGFVGRFSSQIVGRLGEIVGSALGSNEFTNGITKAFNEDNSIASGVMTGIFTAILTGGDIGKSLSVAIGTALHNAKLKAANDNDPNTDPEDWQDILGIASDDFTGFAEGIIEAVVGALSSVNTLGGRILSAISTAIVKAIAGADESTIGGALNDAITGLGGNSIFGAFGTTLATTIMTGGNFGLGLVGGIATFLSDIGSKYPGLITGIKAEAGDFWNKILDIWYGPLEQEVIGYADNGHALYGRATRNGKKGLWSLIKPLLYGDDDSISPGQALIREIDATSQETGRLVEAEVNAKGGLLNWLLGYDTTLAGTDTQVHVAGFGERIWNSIKTAIVGEGGVVDVVDNVYKQIEPKITEFIDNIKAYFTSSEFTTWLDSVWSNIEPTITLWIDTIKGLLQGMMTDLINNNPWLQFLFGNPNTSTVSEAEDGGINIVSTNGEKVSFGKGGISQNAQALLSSLGGYYTIENGKVKMTHGGEDFWSTTGYVGNAGGLTPLKMEDLLNYVINNGILPGEGDRGGVDIGNLRGIEFNSFEDVMNSFRSGKGKGSTILDLLPKVDITTIQSQIDAGSYHVNAVVNTEGEGEGGGKAWGGRIGSAGRYLVGEDGPEYIIPITKSDRAVSLIQQMFGEMGSSAVSRIVGGLGLGQSGTNGASLSSLSSAMSGMTMANTYNINAPVNINVNASGADAKEIGTSVYDLAERHLIKNVMGVYT